MSGSFAELGIREELVETAAAEGYHEPTSLQRAAIPVLRRGGNAVLDASSGAGIRAAYGLAVLDRIVGERAEGGAVERPAALVLVPTDHLMGRVSEALARMARGAGLQVRALTQEWAGAASADVVVSTPDAALDAVRDSRIKLDSVRVLVLDGAASILEIGDPEAIETIVGAVPREAQRVIVSEPARSVDDFVERHVRRALHIPARPAEAEEPGPTTGTMSYVVVGEARKIPALARWLVGQGTGIATVICRSPERAARVESELALRGLTGEGAARVVAGEAEAGSGVVISYDVPFDADELRARHGGGGLVLVEPAELPHLRRIARESSLALRAVNVLGPSAREEAEEFRERIRRAIREEDLVAQMLLIEPLLEEFSGAEVAAAAAAILRRGGTEPGSRAVPAAAPAPPHPSAPAGPAPHPSYVRLFVSVGRRDDLRPGDLVGAITGEANIPGDQVGRIEIRDTFSIVEVSSGVADRVIRALNGSTLKSRSVRADYDRRGGAAPGGRRTTTR